MHIAGRINETRKLEDRSGLEHLDRGLEGDRPLERVQLGQFSTQVQKLDILEGRVIARPPGRRYDRSRRAVVVEH